MTAEAAVVPRSGDRSPDLTPVDAGSFPVPRQGWVMEPTIAMQAGSQQVHQCGWCGTVVIVATIQDEGAPRSLTGKACPTCDQTTHGWWRQDVPVNHSLAGFTFIGSGDEPPPPT